MTRSPALTSSARADVATRVVTMVRMVAMRLNEGIVVLSLAMDLLGCSGLLIGPFFEVCDFDRALDGRDVSVPRNQHRARNVALPRRVDLESQPLGKAVAENPVLGRRQARIPQHRSRGRTKVRDQISADRHDIDRGMSFHELTKLRQLDLARTAGHAPKMDQRRMSLVR